MNTSAPYWTRPDMQLVAYALLLVATPFFLLRAYLQTAIGALSRLTVPVAGTELFIVPLMAALAALLAAWSLRSRLKRRTLPVLLLVLVLWSAGHQVADFYFGHLITDLQHNWHTIAYLLYSLLFWRYAVRRGTPPELTAVPGLLAALLVSTFDEILQVFISSRIFDVGDIGKDAWGATIGLTAIIMHEAWPQLKSEGFRLTRPTLAGYRQAAFPQLVFVLLFSWTLLCTGSLLTDSSYVGLVALLSMALFLLVFLTIHGLGLARWRFPLLALLVLAAAALGWSMATQERGRIQLCKPGLLVYGGLPLPVFDVLIRPSGILRLVDKKHSFNLRDQQTLLHDAGDVLLIGSGVSGNGGLGFPEPFPVQFMPDPGYQRAVQVIVLPTPEACAIYNKLRSEGRRVTFVAHTGC